MATHPAIQYAEDLGLHEVYERGQKARELIDQSMSTLSESRDERRALDEKISYREMDIQIEARVAHPDHSLAAWERDTKTAQHLDTELRDLKRRHRELTDQIEGIEYDLKVLDTDIRLCSARMVELGGYFEYLASAKRAEVARVERGGESGGQS